MQFCSKRVFGGLFSVGLIFDRGLQLFCKVLCGEAPPSARATAIANHHPRQEPINIMGSCPRLRVWTPGILKYTFLTHRYWAIALFLECLIVSFPSLFYTLIRKIIPFLIHRSLPVWYTTLIYIGIFGDVS